MSEEKEIDGFKAKELILSGLISLSDIKGSILYDESKDIEMEILDYIDQKFITKDNTSITLDWLNVGKKQLIIVEPSEEFLSKIEASKTPYQKKLEALQVSLGEIGHDGIRRLNIEEQEYLNSLLKLDRSPTLNEREKFFEIAKKTQKYIWSSNIYSRWLREIEKINKIQPDALGRMHLTFFFRHSGRLKEAIKTSNVFEFSYSKFSCDDRLRAVLGTIRAATFLDIYEYHYVDKEILFIARKTAGKAWANYKSEELSGVYKRLQHFENELSSQSYKKRLNQAYSDWIDWTK